MAQVNGRSIPPLGEGSASVHKRAREESGKDVGDCDEVRGHCPAPTMEENMAAAISMLPDADPTKAHPCDGCGKDMRESGYIRCAECVDPRAVDVCFDCFRQGAEPFKHKKTHGYRVVDRLQAPVCTDDWTAEEELALLNHIGTRGLGTEEWEDLAMSDLFFRRRSASELETRYQDTYLCRYGSVLPPHYLERRADGTTEQVPIALTDPLGCEPTLCGVEVDSRELRGRTMADLGTDPVHRYGPSWQALARKKGDAEVAAAATATATANAGTATGTAAPVWGSMAALSGGSGGGDGGVGMLEGSVQDRAGATAMAAVTAAERETEEAAKAKASRTSRKRRRIEQATKDKEEQRAIKEWIAQLPGADLDAFHSLRGDFEHQDGSAPELLLEDLVFGPTDDARERQLKLGVIEVFGHRLEEREKREQFVVESNLLDSKSQPVVQAAKKTKSANDMEDKEKINMRARVRSLEPFSTPDEHQDLVENLCLSKKLRARLAELEALRQNGIGTMAGGLEFEQNKKRVREQEGGVSMAGLGHGGGAQGRVDVMDITGSKGIEFLSQPEIDLCSRLRMLPPYFLRVKAALLKEFSRVGFLKKKDLPDIVILDIGRLNEIYDFLVASGSVEDQPNNEGNVP